MQDSVSGGYPRPPGLLENHHTDSDKTRIIVRKAPDTFTLLAANNPLMSGSRAFSAIEPVFDLNGGVEEGPDKHR